METKTLAKVLIGIVVVVAIIPFMPTILHGLKGANPENDARNLERVQQAVKYYGEAMGHYPDSLAALVPEYLPEIPAVSFGTAFTYNPRKGTVALPAKAKAAASESAATGLTPMGDAFTGLSVQNELNF